jgi:hypothetical protein
MQISRRILVLLELSLDVFLYFGLQFKIDLGPSALQFKVRMHGFFF